MESNPLFDVIGDQRRFLPCKVFQKKGEIKPSKLPVRRNGKGPTSDDWSNPTYWRTAAEAMQDARDWKLTILSVQWGGPEHDVVGIDLDKCLQQGKIVSERAARIYESLGTYATVSVSQTGLHLYVIDQTHLIPEKFSEVDAVGIYRHSKHFADSFLPFESEKPVRVITDPEEARTICAILGVTPTDKGGPKQQPRTGQQDQIPTDQVERARAALNRLASWRCDAYEDGAWLNVGMALSELGDAGLQLWEEWSKGSAKYKPGMCAKKWKSFKPGKGTTLASLIHWANEDDPAGRTKPNRQQRAQQQRAQQQRAQQQRAQQQRAQQQRAQQQRTEQPHPDGVGPPQPPAQPEGARPIRESSCTDAANADRFAKQNRGRLCHVAEWGWLFHDDQRWCHDKTGAVMRRAKATARSIYGEAADPAISDVEAKVLAKWADTSLSRTRLEAMIKLAQDLLPARPEDFDHNPYLLNCANGTLNLTTGELQPHDANDMITKLAGTDYVPDADCPTWRMFLYRVMDRNANLINFLQRGAGYSCTGDTDEHLFFFLYGTGRNGKSTFTETMQAALGDYGGRVRSETLLLKRDNGVSNDVAGMVGMRAIVASELPEGRRLDEPLIKDLTGGDTMKARFLWQELFTFKPQAKIWMFGNHKPTVRGTDEGIWSRVKMVPFTVTIPSAERDPKLKARMIANELPGILAWMVEGCKAWMRDGLKPPPEVDAATASYRAEMDLLAQFISECCVTHDQARVTSAALHKAYCDWAGSDAMNQVEFGKRLKERGFEAGKGTKGVRIWKGIGLDVPEDQI